MSILASGVAYAVEGAACAAVTLGEAMLAAATLAIWAVGKVLG